MSLDDCVHYCDLTDRWIVARPCNDGSGRLYGPVHAAYRATHGDLVLGELPWVGSVAYAYTSRRDALNRAREIYGDLGYLRFAA
jgi:hypothetical protein